ncbi:NDMA-dependent alcohol dehydrogenase [Mycobacterium sp. CBMA293]|uniref:NDMA-dependent alcohol dehydrogenase n=3 Tax=Mycolicibacterium TaxID=1866885 RepID=UPI0012DCFF1D|nr:MULTISPECIES: NDMA-dependent alcohol dehydrogenase [unclassified Mycolicibacterium]MUL45332.1 NDMA-dependent alcohol dehydrogenase [Mycolicibacterium sp. CBMA 360]MUL56851.1 NDMA-dependent alcohol dehydrogenase [Mycolicibacterium sp. CBMA 335]MUL69891.1 NDMA-dependent alcohol dehydrogenase [Mycolicibacterium sp. CBMA 311]MUL91939.1 NDMA-dependent alcohol dehydrogenase [Mycolicibacterium sp. CBMA 230]MUM05677.1 alcohol dehydrogenase [Mycolicibacterium sp. CBMA 213]
MRSRAAIVREAGGNWVVEEFELDPPRAGEVLLKMAAAGLCHSDDHIRSGFLAAPKGAALPVMPPTIGGHEGSAVVLEVGPGVTRFSPGDHVVTSFLAVCGKCRWCTSGMEYLCDVGAGTLVPGMPTDGTFRHHGLSGEELRHTSKIGAFAEHTVVAADSLVKIDPSLPLVPSALLSCAVPTGYGSTVHRAGVRAGDTVVVIGVGGIGTAAVQGAHLGGASHVIAVDPVAFKRDSALGFGATHGAGTVTEAVALVRDLTLGVMADVVVVSPSEINDGDVADALSLTRKGGTCVLTGMAAASAGAVQLDLQDLILMNKNLCGTLFGSCNPTTEIPALARLYQDGHLKLDEMITRRYRLDDINVAFDDLLGGRVIRAVIDYSLT